MAIHNVIGKKGEELACKYLNKNKIQILERNWRHRRNEIDIIAKDKNEVIVIEVKTRTNSNIDIAHQAINNKKIRAIVKTADAYLRYNKISLPVRFDTICIIIRENNYEIEHIRDAFSAPLN